MRDLSVAVILDEFSLMAFGFEWNAITVQPGSWKQTLESCLPDLLFVESAWAGNSGAWQYKLTGNNGPSEDLISLVEWCQQQGIPTVFWNKEDPPHYEDFLGAARLFDVVFTSDQRKIPDYIRDLGHDRVDVLPFAAQPAVHNPVRPSHGWHERGIAFAGMYFTHKYPERRAQLDYLLSGAVAGSKGTGFGLEIFSRMLGGDPRYQFPDHFSGYVVGQLPYEEMLTAYKSYKVFLNVNSVTDSPSMCARRIFEIEASGTPVVTAPSAAIGEFFPPDEVWVARNALETQHSVRALIRNEDIGERAAHLAQRRIWAQHTYTQRVSTILETVKRRDEIRSPYVSCLVATNRPYQLDHVFSQFGQQTYESRQLVILTHGFEPAAQEIKNLQSRYAIEEIKLIHGFADRTLGECLNELIDASDGDVLSKMDDDDLYGPHYLQDLVNALSFSGADVVGKGAHYMRIEGLDVLLRRFADKEHRFANHVMGPTITAPRSLFTDIRFAALKQGEDTEFLSRVVASGASIYAADRFNFVQVRKSHQHTWRLSDLEALSLGDVEVHGNFGEHVFI
ncbi:glycosyltransferase family protein [Pseudarthrobacter sp. J1738]|uniref:glycosyltransferase family protein n=1 Tax=unclassified Pseudarthrobacter TaxID=2647000 RepID=UPI003D280602